MANNGIAQKFTANAESAWRNFFQRATVERIYSAAEAGHIAEVYKLGYMQGAIDQQKHTLNLLETGAIDAK